METSSYDYKKFAILYVDDEEKSLKYFARAFRDHFRIFTAHSAQEGLAVLEAHADEIAILMTDQRMPGEKGTWLLEKARQLRPDMVRILATAYADMDAAIAAVNTGSIYKYITKPWDPPQLETTLKRGLEFFIVQRERDQLLSERMSALHKVVVAERITSVGLLASGLSHHVRNSLVAVKTFLELAPDKLKAENVNPDKLRNPDFWNGCHHNALVHIEKINTLCRELIAASGQGVVGFKDQVGLHGIVRDALARLTTTSVQFENRVSELLPLMTVERTRFERLFELLFQDELASLPPGSVVTISATHRSASGVDPESIIIELTDNGPGLSDEMLGLVFDPFSLRSDSPLEYGIHLMAVYFIVHYHGGHIEAERATGQGTTFRITLPVNCELAPRAHDDTRLLDHAMSNERLWEKLKVAE